MKAAVVGSRGIVNLDLSKYLPSEVTCIVSGGAKGVDSIAAEYARAKGLELQEFLPDYSRYGRGAPLKRNELIRFKRKFRHSAIRGSFIISKSPCFDNDIRFTGKGSCGIGKYDICQIIIAPIEQGNNFRQKSFHGYKVHIVFKAP